MKKNLSAMSEDTICTLLFLLPISVCNYKLKNQGFISPCKNIFCMLNVSFSYLVSLVTKVASPEFCSVIHLAVKIQKEKFI